MYIRVVCAFMCMYVCMCTCVYAMMCVHMCACVHILQLVQATVQKVLISPQPRRQEMYSHLGRLCGFLGPMKVVFMSFYLTLPKALHNACCWNSFFADEKTVAHGGLSD